MTIALIYVFALFAQCFLVALVFDTPEAVPLVCVVWAVGYIFVMVSVLQ